MQMANEVISVWDELAPFHQAQLGRYGFAEFKRHVNFQYGQWAVSKYLDRKVFWLMGRMVRDRLLPQLTGEVDWNDAWPRPDFNDTGLGWTDRGLRAYAFYTGLLWQFALFYDRLGVLNIEEPDLGHPMPVRLGWRRITQDEAVSALDLNLMNEHMPLLEKKNVLEIGGGYGRLAYFFKRLVPDCRYTIVDIDPALGLSQRYLGECGVKVEFSRTIDESERYDLVINTSSFDEMPAVVSTAYLRTIERVCHGHVFVNGYSRASHDYRGRSRLGLDELVYGDAWRVLYAKRHRFNPGWVDKVFELAIEEKVKKP